VTTPPPDSPRVELDASPPVQDPPATPGTLAAAGRRRRWPLLVIGASAGTAVWSGWVGLGQLVGFGIVHPLPGIWDAATLNTAITLPVGVEAYAMYALSVATGSTPITRTARRFAWTSSVASLLLGMVGQVAYHLMNANHVTAAPWPIVAGVSCLPVLVLGVASVLWHLAGQHPDPVGAVPAAATAVAPGGTAAADAAPHPHLVQPVPAPTPPALRTGRGGRGKAQDKASEMAAKAAKVARLRAAHPDWTYAQIGARAEVSAKTVSRYLKTTSAPSSPVGLAVPAGVDEDAA